MESDAQPSGGFSLMSFFSYTNLSYCDMGFLCESSVFFGVGGWELSQSFYHVDVPIKSKVFNIIRGLVT